MKAPSCVSVPHPQNSAELRWWWDWGERTRERQEEAILSAPVLLRQPARQAGAAIWDRSLWIKDLSTRKETVPEAFFFYFRDMHIYMGKGLLITEFQAMKWTWTVYFLFPRSWASSFSTTSIHCKSTVLNKPTLDAVHAKLLLSVQIPEPVTTLRHLAYPNPYHN